MNDRNHQTDSHFCAASDKHGDNYQHYHDKRSLSHPKTKDIVNSLKHREFRCDEFWREV
ncbi:MAG: hypothetical protein HQK53_13190, partial [Oligoflexia bacterium]|nr:hypothetical protein [Oligoflexia bacterium]